MSLDRALRILKAARKANLDSSAPAHLLAAVQYLVPVAPIIRLPDAELRKVILSYCDKAPSSSITIIRHLEDDRLAASTPGDGAILAILHQLELDGLVRSTLSNTDGDLVYSITESGTAALKPVTNWGLEDGLQEST